MNIVMFVSARALRYFHHTMDPLINTILLPCFVWVFFFSCYPQIFGSCTAEWQKIVLSRRARATRFPPRILGCLLLGGGTGPSPSLCNGSVAICHAQESSHWQQSGEFKTLSSPDNYCQGSTALLTAVGTVKWFSETAPQFPFHHLFSDCSASPEKWTGEEVLLHGHPLAEVGLPDMTATVLSPGKFKT